MSSTDRKLAELLDAATTDVPAGYLAPPLAAIHGRVRRRRRMLGAATAAAVAVVLAGGYSVGQRMLAEPAPQVPIGPAASPTPVSSSPVSSSPVSSSPVSSSPASSTSADEPAGSWVSAMVARDDTTITFYAGAKRCKEFTQPRAQITAQDATQVTVKVTGKVVPADDCTTSGEAVPIVVTLPEPLGGRKLVDAVSLRSHPTYFERYLPDLGSGGRWSPTNVSWQSDDVNWYGAYNGPNGSELNVRAQVPDSVQQREPVGKVDLGGYEGTITGDSAMWAVWWQAGDATYSLQLVPSEGGSFTLAEFKQELAGLF